MGEHQTKDSTGVLLGLLEKLAAIEHQRWADWQRALHAKCERLPDGSLRLPAEFVTRWERQVATSYEDLDEAEKERDREQVRRYLPLIEAALER